MILSFFFFFFSFFQVQVVTAQTENTAVQEKPSATPEAPAAAPTAEGTTPEAQIPDAAGYVLKNNNFTYDINEGRDPFKIFREIPLFVPGNETKTKDISKPEVVFNGQKTILTAVVPIDVVVMGILFKKIDPIALVSVKGVKGINKLMVNSPIGRNEGKVIEIKKDQIVIEQVKDFDGQKFTEKVVLKVREKKK